MTSDGCDRRSHEQVRASSPEGYTLVELSIAAAITLVVLSAVFASLGPSRGLLRTQPAMSDMQQRMRVAVDLLQTNLRMAGAGVDAESALGSLISFVPPILPYRVGRLRADPSRDVYFRHDAISVLSAAPASQTTILNTISSRSVQVMIGSECVGPGAFCGFSAGDTVLVFNETGAGDTFRITRVGGPGLQLEHQGQVLSKTYVHGSYITRVKTETYYYDSGRDQLRRYDGWNTDLPLVDDVVNMSFRYFGDPRPPLLPKPAIGTENCLFDRFGNPKLEPLGRSASLVELTEALVTDGPWCGVPGNRFDADLYRIRSIEVFLRMQVSPRTLRGKSPTLFRRPGPARVGLRPIPDYAVSFEVTPRNINLMR